MGSSHRRNESFADRQMETCPRRSRMFIDLVRTIEPPLAFDSLLPLPSPEPMISGSRGLPGCACYDRQPAFQAKIVFPTQLPRIAAGRNPEEWIA